MHTKVPRTNVSVGIIPLLPYVFPCFVYKSWCPRNNIGISAEIFQIIADEYKLSVKYVPIPRTERVTKIYRMVQNGSLDTSVILFADTYTRRNDVAFSGAALHSKFVWIIRRDPTPSLDMQFLMFRPFVQSVWIALFLTLSLVFLTLNITKKFSRTKQNGDVLAGATGNSTLAAPGKGIGFNIVGILWAFGVVMLTRMYCNDIIRYLLTPVGVPPFTSTNELNTLLEAGTYRLLSYYKKDYAFFRLLRNSRSRDSQLLYETVQKGYRLTRKTELLRILKSDPRYITVSSAISAQFMMKGQLLCDYHLIPDESQSVPTGLAFIFPKGKARIVPNINRILGTWIRLAGQTGHIVCIY